MTESTGQIIIGLLGSAITIWAFLKDRYWLLLLLTFIYVIFWILLLINQYVGLENIHTFISGTNFVVFHVLGCVFLLCSIVMPIRTKKQRKILSKKIKVLISKDPFLSYQRETEEMLTRSEEEIQDELLKFSADANETIILGGFGNFLIKQNGEPTEQYKRIKKDAHNFKILLNHKVTDKPLISLLHDLEKEGTKIKIYSTDNKYLRGRIKETDIGKSALLYNLIGNDRYRFTRLDNQYIVSLLYDKLVDDIDEKGTNIFIKHICFDLGGVFYSGDIKNFFHKLKDYNLEISPIYNDYLCIDEELNLDRNYDIIQYLYSKFPQKSKQKIIRQEKDNIIWEWKNIWKINEPIQKLAVRLQSLGYTIALCSNCDFINGEHYKLSGYFKNFDSFLSYECNCLKPSEQYFKIILNKYSCQPYEVLFIDNHQKNTDVAKSLGFETIFVNSGISDEDKIKYIQQELIKININNQ